MSRDLDSLFSRIVEMDRIALGQAMTIVESELPEDRADAVELLEKCEQRLSANDPSLRLAISGAPGVGKSSLIEALGLKAIDQGYKVGVITIDPSSSLSKGSILGDKSRMMSLSNTSSAFIRSSPAGAILGGLGRRTLELTTLLAAVGYDLILIETVGVGQSEHMAWQLTDGFILVIQPGAGDELQGIKRGITELADMVVVNKADGDLLPAARAAKSHYQNALHYFTPLRKGWTPCALLSSALTGDGIPELLDTINQFKDNVRQNMSVREIRKLQQDAWLEWNLTITAHQLLLHHPAVRERLGMIRARPANENISIFKAAHNIEHLMQSLIHANAKHF